MMRETIFLSCQLFRPLFHNNKCKFVFPPSIAGTLPCHTHTNVIEQEHSFAPTFNLDFLFDRSVNCLWSSRVGNVRMFCESQVSQVIVRLMRHHTQLSEKFNESFHFSIIVSIDGLWAKDRERVTHPMNSALIEFSFSSPISRSFIIVACHTTVSHVIILLRFFCLLTSGGLSSLCVCMCG